MISPRLLQTLGVGLALLSALLVGPKVATAFGSGRVHTNCMTHIAGIAMTSDAVAYACADPGDHDIYIVPR